MERKIGPPKCALFTACGTRAGFLVPCLRTLQHGYAPYKPYRKALHGKDVAIVGVNPIDKQYDKIMEQYKKQCGYSFDIAFAESITAD